MIEIEDTLDKLVQDAPPKVTPTPLKNPVPVIVTLVPPPSAPLDLVTEVIVGAA